MQIDSSKLSLSSIITLQQFLSSHHFNSQNTTVPAWTSFLQAPTPFNLNLQIKDLPVGQLAEAQITQFNDQEHPIAGTLFLDHDANGLGWFIDSTPFENSEFGLSLTDSAFKATQGSAAYGRYDLLTTILHELGHLAGILSGNPNYDQYAISFQDSPSSKARRSTCRSSFTGQLSPGRFLRKATLTVVNHWRSVVSF